MIYHSDIGFVQIVKVSQICFVLRQWCHLALKHIQVLKLSIRGRRDADDVTREAHPEGVDGGEGSL